MSRDISQARVFAFWRNGRSRIAATGILAGTIAAFSASSFAFFEEADLEAERNESTIHYSMVWALATCAGYEEMAARVATFDQLTDLGSDPSYEGSLCEGWVPAPPANPVQAAQQGAVLTDLVDGPLNGCAEWTPLTFPNDEKGHDPACFTDRFRGSARFFHFPNEEYVSRLREWAFTPDVPLAGHVYAAYGGFTALPLSWRCTAEWNDQIIDTGPVSSNSIEAFGVYLHSLADFSSHYECVNYVESDALALNIPTHFGQWGSSYCSFFEHYDELETDTPEMEGQAPLSRTLESAVGHDAMEWFYDGDIPHHFDYDFLGIYTELLAWRNANPDLFEGNPSPVPMSLDNMDYQEVMEMVKGMILDNAGTDGRYNGMYRIENAQDVAAFCVSIQGL